MFVSNFAEVIKDLLKDLPKNDYPVLNSFLSLLLKSEIGSRLAEVFFST